MLHGKKIWMKARKKTRKKKQKKKRRSKSPSLNIKKKRTKSSKSELNHLVNFFGAKALFGWQPLTM